MTEEELRRKLHFWAMYAGSDAGEAVRDEIASAFRAARGNGQVTESSGRKRTGAEMGAASARGTGQRRATMTTKFTADTLPNNISSLRTGTANDGRMLVYAGHSEGSQQSVLAAIRRRLPHGWTAEIYAPSGVDVVITHVG